MSGFLAGLECTRCSLYYPGDTERALCDCGSTLLARYDLAGIRKAVTPSDIARRAPTMWRYRELLPVRDDAAIVTMGEGFTPMIPVPKAARAVGVGELWVKTVHDAPAQDIVEVVMLLVPLPAENRSHLL